MGWEALRSQKFSGLFNMLQSFWFKLVKTIHILNKMIYSDSFRMHHYNGVAIQTVEAKNQSKPVKCCQLQFGCT